MKYVSVPVYRLDELCDAAKATAREQYREHYFDCKWWDAVIEDAKACGSLLGINIDNIYFSLAYAQGDGAKLTGAYRYLAKSPQAIRSYVCSHDYLCHFADRLAAIQRPHFYQLTATVHDRPIGSYQHEHTTRIDVEDARTGLTPPPDVETALCEALRDFMRWIYRQLRDEYEALTADSCVDEAIDAHDLWFANDGTRFGHG